MSGVVSASAMSRVAPGVDRPIRVCLVGPSLDILGGQAVVLDQLRRRLEEVGELEVSFLAINPRLPGVFGTLQRVKFARTFVTSTAYLWSLCRQLRHADVVHAFSASYWSFLLAPVPAMLVGRLYGKTVVLNYHSGEADDHLANWKTALPLMRLAHAIVVPSEYLVDVFGRHGLCATAIFNFVEKARLLFRQRTTLQPRFFSNRNLEPLYNVACTIRAFDRIQREMPEAELVVAGDGSERATLEALVRQLRLRNVRFLGRVSPSEMPALYDAAEVYLNSSAIDNMPMSIIEAFASGLPVVTTNAGGIPYIVRHEANALMVPSDDDEALASQALRLIRDPDLASRLAIRARHECLERYVWPSVCEAWLAVYGDTIATSRRGSSPLRSDAA